MSKEIKIENLQKFNNVLLKISNTSCPSSSVGRAHGF